MTETPGFCCYTDCMSNYEGTCRHGLTAGYDRDRIIRCIQTDTIMKKTATETIDSEIKSAIHDASLMLAQEAYNRVSKAKSDRISDLVRMELRECGEHIEKAVKQENYKTEIPMAINQRTVECLRELSYDVQVIQEKSINGAKKTIISWDFGRV